MFLTFCFLGKSTLLDIIADRKLDGRWSGNIFFDNKYRSKYFGRDSAYVLQDDIHIATLTVEVWHILIAPTLKILL